MEMFFLNYTFQYYYLGYHGFDDIGEPPEKQSRKRLPKKDEDKQIDSVVIALSSLASDIKSSVKRPNHEPAVVQEKLAVLLECEEFCLYFAKKMATIESELSRDLIRRGMDKLYFTYNHNIQEP